MYNIMITDKIIKIEDKASHVTGLGGPQSCETSRLPHFLGSQLAVRLSALHAGDPLPTRKIAGTHFS
jgi:hypothetical protein